MDNITIQWSENTWIWLSIDYSWSFINNFDNIYEAWSSWTYQKIVTETKRHLKKIWDNYYQYTFFEEWKYSPITTEQISEIIATTFREIIPPYTRIKRLIRDIPATEIAAGSNITNLSQLMHERLLKEYKDKPEIAKKFYERI